ncbi:CubicO group peptidase, beta-lactamase class C family [Parasphingorhabdus marina DSM 22363]|uniref:CubicO group peptidase, beta-lactamase class C family n=1 Tax=Parasphingorhabdus marina DSM 22363 TaxID=1123272 RepID=A0A1N6CN94_9SPHN|nr:serine hydrolase domain-containing protein [Parasphingorhabdus marina]SIN59972.1 CubicO group peptidase, beta-lactamase class C family [Parasphingorhabdus marina DSM 22363]
MSPAKRPALLAVLLLFASASAPALAAEEKVIDQLETFGQFLADFRKEKSIRALTAVIVKDGKIRWEQALGTSDDEGDIPATMDTTFSIASVTKPIAATAIIRESLADRVSRDLPLSAHAGWEGFCAWFAGSGIPFGGGGVDSDSTPIASVRCDPAPRLSEILNMRANGDPDGNFVYNPMAYARIDRAITAGGGRALRDILRDNVLTPAGMSDVALGWQDPEGGSALRLLAPPFTVREDGSDEKASFADDDLRAAAGIIASARHVAQFDMALDRGDLLPEAWTNRITKGALPPAKGDYRWGWFVQDWNGHRLVWHSGWEPERYSAIYLKVPGKRLSLIVLANNENLWWSNPLTGAAVEGSPVAARFLELFVGED